MNCSRCGGLLKYDRDYPAMVCMSCSEVIYVVEANGKLYREPLMPFTPMRERTVNSSRSPRLGSDGVDRKGG